MSNFSQWWQSFSIKGEVRQFTWVCGREQVLVDEVVESIRAKLDPDPWDYIPLTVGEVPLGELWGNILQYPISITPRLIVVREAQDIKDTGRIVDLIRKRRLSPQTFVVFVSSDAKVPKITTPDGETRAPHIAAFSGKGHVVECNPFTQATAKHAVAWVQSKKTMRIGVAAHLLDRANGDLRLVRDLCRKLSLFTQEPTITMVNELMREYPRDTFSNALMSLDKKTALIALGSLSPEDYSAVLGSLDAHLELAGMVHDMLVSHKTVPEISKAAGSKRFLVPDLLPVARNYDARRQAAIRQLLCDADEALRLGERMAVMETVVALW